jgi:hypothetical protein
MHPQSLHLSTQEGVELLPDVGTPTHQLNGVWWLQFVKREQGSGDRGLHGEISTHRVQRDARQRQASLAATRCSPA